MNIQEAKELLTVAIKNLHNKNGVVTRAQLETEVINSACLYLLRTYKNQIHQVHNTTMIINVMGTNLISYQKIAQNFTNAALELFPQDYSADLANHGNMSIIQNISWSGMYDFLKSYYHTNHGISIDNNPTDTIIFNSKRHDRFEYNTKVSDAIVDRQIILNFTEQNKKLIVEITPTMSPKTAHLISDSQNQKKYKGDDPDFEFIIYYDNLGKIEKFMMERLDKNTKWFYQ